MEADRQTQQGNKTSYMNKWIIRGNWNVLKGKLKQRWSQLTEDDLQYIEGQEDELLGRIQKRVGARWADIEQYMQDAVLEESHAPHGLRRQSC